MNEEEAEIVAWWSSSSDAEDGVTADLWWGLAIFTRYEDDTRRNDRCKGVPTRFSNFTLVEEHLHNGRCKGVPTRFSIFTRSEDYAAPIRDDLQSWLGGVSGMPPDRRTHNQDW